MIRELIVVLCLVAWSVCPGLASAERAEGYRLITRQTLDGMGAIQGVSERGGKIYIFGDADAGVIGEFTLDRDGPALLPTGRVIRLTVDGLDALPHPTGLAFPPEDRPDLPVFLGDTVRRVGVIHAIDFERALRIGTLDGAILNSMVDDLAVNGCRPEYVRVEEDGPDGVTARWLIATADYGDTDNAVRLYDPAVLARTTRTSHPGVLVKSLPSGTFVQSLRWEDERSELVLVQNRVQGLLYRLTFMRLDGSSPIVVDLDEPRDELEGYLDLGDGLVLMVSATPPGKPNASFFRVR
jgi:hypothetical protein